MQTYGYCPGALGAVMLVYLYPLRLTPPRLIATDIVHALFVDLLPESHDSSPAKAVVKPRAVTRPVPGWTANGIEPWGLQMDPIGATGNLFFKGFFLVMLGLHLRTTGDERWNDPFDLVDRATAEIAADPRDRRMRERLDPDLEAELPPGPVGRRHARPPSARPPREPPRCHVTSSSPTSTPSRAAWV